MAINSLESPQEHIRNVLMVLVALPSDGEQVTMAEADRTAMRERLERAVQQVEGGARERQADQRTVQAAGQVV